MLATRITCSALRVSAVGISSLEKSCRGQPSALLQPRRLADRHAAPDVLLQGSTRRDAAGGCRAKNFRQIGLRIGLSLDGVEGGAAACLFLGASTRHGLYRGVRRDVFPPPASNRRLVPFFFNGLRAKVRRYARSDLHKMEHRTGPRLHFSELGMSEAQPPARSPPQAPRAQGVRRPGPARGPERCGRPCRFGSQTAPKIRWICPTDLSDPPGCTNPGPGRLAQKMSVVSVEPPARGAPGGIAA